MLNLLTVFHRLCRKLRNDDIGWKFGFLSILFYLELSGFAQFWRLVSYILCSAWCIIVLAGNYDVDFGVMFWFVHLFLFVVAFCRFWISKLTKTLIVSHIFLTEIYVIQSLSFPTWFFLWCHVRLLQQCIYDNSALKESDILNIVNK